MKNNIYKGYIASRNIRELQIPQRIQNMLIRLYAEKKGKVFSLSATEYIMDNCFMMLNALVAEAENYEAIVVYSLFMLPDNIVTRNKFFETCLQKKTEIHFAFEELAIKSTNDIALINDILMAKNLTQSLGDQSWLYKNL